MSKTGFLKAVASMLAMGGLVQKGVEEHRISVRPASTVAPLITGSAMYFPPKPKRCGKAKHRNRNHISKRARMKHRMRVKYNY